MLDTFYTSGTPSRSELTHRLQRLIQRRGLGARELASLLALDADAARDLVTGRATSFSTTALAGFLATLGGRSADNRR